MLITANSWSRFSKKLAAINQKAADEMLLYVRANGYYVNQNLIDFAYSLATKYGEAAGELACQMYDELATYWSLSHDKKMTFYDSAEMAETPSRDEVARAVFGAADISPNNIVPAVARLVKQVGADTTLNNAIRDGAFVAWIPKGDTCAFCMTLASNGWQRVSKKTLKNGHAEHIHANCDCAYGVKFDPFDDVEGYDPDEYYDLYNSQSGSPKERINAMRRLDYAENRKKINAQHRAAYADRQELKESE